MKVLFFECTLLCLSLIICAFNNEMSEELPTLYEYYTDGGINSGLVAEGHAFQLNGRELRILGGSINYFRVPQEYWKDRLLKMRAAGLNLVRIYVPWNLHEETPGSFNFDGMLDLEGFLQDVKEADMFAIFAPGPMIFADIDLGGLPSWLLKDSHMKVRSNYTPFLTATEKYFEKVIAIAKRYQFTHFGGPIIAVQIENEFAVYGNTTKNEGDKQYMTFLRDILIKFGINELMLTCDYPQFEMMEHGSLPGLLKTINFRDKVKENIKNLTTIQPNRPVFVSEFWAGWFDSWGKKHDISIPTEKYIQVFQNIIDLNASVNVHMFHGGTSFGFLAANGFCDRFSVTSYDFDAPISESGDYHPKYWKTKEMIERLMKDGKIPATRWPSSPHEVKKAKYGSVKIMHQLSYEHILSHVKPIESNNLMSMEMLDIGPNYGQQFGFILYRTDILKFEGIKLFYGEKDRSIVMIDNKIMAVHLEKSQNPKTHQNITFESNNSTEVSKVGHQLDILVENMGRCFWKTSTGERKGILGSVWIDDRQHFNWTIYPLDFKQSFINQLRDDNNWIKANEPKSTPGMFRTILEIKDKPQDTFIDMRGWTKGNVFINGFNLGRYWSIGPQNTLYLPAPFLKEGENELMIFELHFAGESIKFVDKPIIA